MKKAVVAGVLCVMAAAVGCRPEAVSGSATPAPADKPGAVSNAGAAFSLGATSLNGTNAGTNVTVGIRSREGAK